MTVNAKQERRARKKGYKAAKRVQRSLESSQVFKAAVRAADAYTAAKPAVPADSYKLLLDDLAERGAPPDILELVAWLVGMARQWDTEYAPAIAATEQMAPVLNLEVDGMAEKATGVRRKIAEGLLLAASWTPEAI